MRDFRGNPILIRYGYAMTLVCPRPTPVICLLDVHEDHLSDMQEVERVVTRPRLPMTVHRDAFGNLCRRFVAPEGTFTFSANGVMLSTDEPDPAGWGAAERRVEDLPEEALQFLTGSRYCETDRMSQLAWDLFGAVPPGWGRVQSVIDYVNDHLTFDYQQARSTRTALEAWQERVGVCRDFAHLAITLCRALNIPARYVNGYLGDIRVPPVPCPMDFSAWMEVWLGDRWWTLDPRHNARRVGRIVIARGRDAADVPLINSFGPHELREFRVWTDEVTAPEGAVPAGHSVWS